MYSRTSRVALPLEMYAVMKPRGRASLKTSTAHSEVISGSLYEVATTDACWRWAISTNCRGVTSIGSGSAPGSPRARGGSPVLAVWPPAWVGGGVCGAGVSGVEPGAPERGRGG